jgi:hypothetical protein
MRAALFQSRTVEDGNHQVMPISPTLPNTFQHSQLIIILALAAVSARTRRMACRVVFARPLVLYWCAETSIFARSGALLPLCAGAGFASLSRNRFRGIVFGPEESVCETFIGIKMPDAACNVCVKGKNIQMELLKIFI